MSDPDSPPLHRSVFGKILAITVAMAVVLLAAVAAVFWLMVLPNLQKSIQQFGAEYARLVVQSAPTLEEARVISGRMDLAIRYEGDRNSWTTDPELPSIASVMAHGPQPGPGEKAFLIIGTKDGTGRYLFVWNFEQRMRAMQLRQIGALLGIMLVVISGTHVMLTRLLRPIHSLSRGVSRLSQGQLDVALPDDAQDEFGGLARAFNRMVTRVRDMLTARDRLLQDVSHELRSPLTRIKVAMEFMPDSDKRRQVMADVGEMQTMISGLLELERLRDGRPLRRERCDLVALSRDVIAQHSGRHPGVELETPLEHCWANLDADTIRTVLRNLLENALTHSLPDSGPVTVSIARESSDVVLTVTDEGVGIPKRDRARVFEPFFRVDGSRSRKTGGYGLGLSICRRIVEAHFGTIRCEAGPIRGSVFVIAVPASAGFTSLQSRNM